MNVITSSNLLKLDSRLCDSKTRSVWGTTIPRVLSSVTQYMLKKYVLKGTNGLMQNVLLLLTCSIFVSLEDWLQLQLVNGSGRCSGRVEVSYHGQRGRVCDDHWDMNEADVVCRQLNCGRALAAPVEAHFGEGEGKFLLDDVDCTGRESFLGQCPHTDWSLHNCGPGEDAGVVCSGNGHLFLRGCTSH